jgi:protein TonB
MFETVAPEAFRKKSRTVLYSTLPMSVIVHGLAVAGSVGMAMSHLDFPTQSPPLVRAYILAEPPPPPPPPPPPAPKPQAQVQQPVQAPKPVQIADLAPTVIPDVIPVITNEVVPPPVVVPTTAAPVSAGPATGSSEGSVGGVEGGVPLIPINDGKLHVKLGVPLPMKVLRQEYPEYPEDARSRGFEDSLLVHYTVGKDGRVKDIVIVDPPNREIFEYAVRKAMSGWRFRPYTDEHGEPQEVVHEIQFNFQLH